MNQYSLQEIPQFYQWNERVGTAGQPRAEQFAWLKEAGYELVINLSAKPDWPEALPIEKSVPNERALVEREGMQYVFAPVDWFRPASDDLEAFFKLMNDNKGRRVFVHCALNCRVSAFLFLYRVIYENASPEEAKRHVDPLWVAATGKPPEEHPVWTNFIQEALQRHQARAKSRQAS